MLSFDNISYLLAILEAFYLQNLRVFFLNTEIDALDLYFWPSFMSYLSTYFVILVRFYSLFKAKFKFKVYILYTCSKIIWNDVDW